MSDTAPQDLSKLETAFAADAKAFVPLTNAYLQLGRFMEAMVVCKKGIKAVPESVEGRLLLGRVYAEQGKVPKALEEIKCVLGTNPENADAHFFHGQMLEKSGRFEEAIEEFKETIRCNRKHDGAWGTLKAKGINFNPGPSPEEIAAQRAAEEAARRAAEEAEAARRAEEERRAAEAAAEAAAVRVQQAKAAALSAAMGGSPRLTGSMPHLTGSLAALDPALSAAPQTVHPAFAAAYAQTLYGYQGPQTPIGKKGHGFGFTFGLAALLLLVIVGIVGGLTLHRRQQDEVLALLKEQQGLVKKDTTIGHKKALDKLEAALKIDDDNVNAVSQYAYSLNLLNERGVKEVETKVVQATARAKTKAPDHPLSVAAQMIAARIAGNAADAEAIGRRQRADPRALPVPVRVELGRALAAQGKVADMIAFADTLRDTPDVNALVFAGEVYRRTGDMFRARQALDKALKLELYHDPARGLRALLILEMEDVVNLPVALDDVTTLLDLGKDALGNRQRGYATLGRALIGQRVRAGSEKETQRDIDTARGLLRADAEMPLFDALQAKSNKDWDTAIKQLGDALKLDAFRLAPYLQLIEVGARAKKFDVADKAYNDANAIFGDNLDLGLARAGRLNAENKSDDALAHLQSMLKTNDVAEVHRDIGKVWMTKGDVQKSVENLKKAAEKASSRSPGIQAHVYTWLGRALAKADDHAQAKESYAQALAATSEFPSTYYWLAVSLEALEEQAAAKEALQKYLRVEPQGVYAEDAKSRLASSGG
ncbi:MAG: tetratricopeptide repeat protein [Deltaproteobacteria bacterium]|nr:tetratricopeptide repeat protein [Deltaproteobacteria bacterium]